MVWGGGGGGGGVEGGERRESLGVGPKPSQPLLSCQGRCGGGGGGGSGFRVRYVGVRGLYKGESAGSMCWIAAEAWRFVLRCAFIVSRNSVLPLQVGVWAFN